MKRKHIIILSSLSALLIAGVASFALIKKANLLPVSSKNTVYTMTLDKNNKMKDQSHYTNGERNGMLATVKTDIGTIVNVDYSYFEAIYGGEDFTTFQTNDYVAFTDPINGLIKMEYEIACESENQMVIEAGYSPNSLIYQEAIRFGGEAGNLKGTISFIDMASEYGISPCYFKIAAKALTPEQEGETYYYSITSLKVYYTCAMSPDPTKPTGDWTYVENDDYFDMTTEKKSITLTSFTLSGGVPYDKTLVVPSIYEGHKVTRVVEGLLNNVGWLEKVVVPFVGEAYDINKSKEGVDPAVACTYNFGFIFGKNSAHAQYVAMQQYEGTTANVWYVPKNLKHVIVNIGNDDAISPETYHVIPAYGFYGLISSIKTIEICNNVGQLNEYSFTNSKLLTELVLPESVESILDNSFMGCSRLMIRALNPSLVISDNANPGYRPYSVGYVDTIRVESIDYDICVDADGEEYVNILGSNDFEVLTIPKVMTYQEKSYEVRRIANRAFEDHVNLKEVMMRDCSNIELVGHYAFHNCYKANIYLEANVTARPDIYLSNWNEGVGGTFDRYERSSVSDHVRYHELATANVIYEIDEQIDRLDLITTSFKDKKLIFPAFALENNNVLNQIALPKNTVLSKYAFANCSSLNSVIYEGTKAEWEQWVRDGNVGPNVFLGTSVTSIECSDTSSEVLSPYDLD